ncbi:hypothetical protein Tco_0795400 [Tanacetum coccineum]
MTLSLSSERSLYNALTLLHPDYEASCPSRPVTSLNQVFIASSSDAGGAFLWGYLCQESIGAYGFGISIMPPRKDQNGTTLAYKNPTPQSVTKPNFCNGLTKALTALATLKIVAYRSDCPELKNQNHRNQAEDTGAHGLVHALGKGESDQDLNDMDDDISA